MPLGGLLFIFSRVLVAANPSSANLRLTTKNAFEGQYLLPRHLCQCAGNKHGLGSEF